MKKTTELVQIALFSGILCVLSPFTIPVPLSAVPLSLATFAVYLAGALLGAKKGACSVLVYLLLGCFGLPVFSGCSGGAGVLFGPTGGYLIGYLPCAMLTGWLSCRPRGRAQVAKNAFAMATGTLSCYFLGTLWFLKVMGNAYTPGQAFFLCVVPYLLFDTIKILAAAAVALPVKKILWRLDLR